MRSLYQSEIEKKMSSHDVIYTKVAPDAPLADAIETNEDLSKSAQVIEFEYDDDALLHYHVTESNWLYLINLISMIPACIVYMWVSDFINTVWTFVLFIFNIALVGCISPTVARVIVPWVVSRNDGCNFRPPGVLRAFTTATRIEIVQPKVPKSTTPNGGVIFIPYSDVESIQIGVSTSLYGYDVTIVTIIFGGLDICNYVGQGYPSIRKYGAQPKKFVVELLGVKEPYTFMKEVLERKSLQNNVGTVEAVSVSEIV